MRITRRIAAATLAALTAAALVTVAPSPAGAATGPEYELLAATNASRAAAGVAPLKLSSAVSDRVARPWSWEMQHSSTLKHNPGYGAQLSVIAPWSGAAENVGYAWSVAQMHNAFLGSAGHRANLMNPAYNYVGIGIVADGIGRLWFTLNFLKTTAALPVDTPAAAPECGRLVGWAKTADGWETTLTCSDGTTAKLVQPPGADSAPTTTRTLKDGRVVTISGATLAQTTWTTAPQLTISVGGRGFWVRMDVLGNSPAGRWGTISESWNAPSHHAWCNYGSWF